MKAIPDLTERKGENIDQWVERIGVIGAMLTHPQEFEADDIIKELEPYGRETINHAPGGTGQWSKIMKLYIYSLDNDELTATVTGTDNNDCLKKAEESYNSNDYYYSFVKA
jgi:hypothetical protein